MSPVDANSLQAFMPAGGSFNWMTLFCGVVFGIIGFYAFRYGRRESLMKPMMIGIALMGYSYLVPNAIAQAAIGVVLTALLFIWKD